MKGTAARGRNAAEDAEIIAAMKSDIKTQAENRMIVDLLRNDISRITEVGTLDVPKLFDIETYPPVHQMVSHVRARLVGGTTIGEIFAALFPCGSVTGAPKCGRWKSSPNSKAAARRLLRLDRLDRGLTGGCASTWRSAPSSSIPAARPSSMSAAASSSIPMPRTNMPNACSRRGLPSAIRRSRGEAGLSRVDRDLPPRGGRNDAAPERPSRPPRPLGPAFRLFSLPICGPARRPCLRAGCPPRSASKSRQTGGPVSPIIRSSRLRRTRCGAPGSPPPDARPARHHQPQDDLARLFTRWHGPKRGKRHRGHAASRPRRFAGGQGRSPPSSCPMAPAASSPLPCRRDVSPACCGRNCLPRARRLRPPSCPRSCRPVLLSRQFAPRLIAARLA